ncbi:MAG: hypothetical protein J1D77_03585 [Muribaculaceae bacterium]|nr:hypothetical protein [Muribaculaceae bacterium]
MELHKLKIANDLQCEIYYCDRDIKLIESQHLFDNYLENIMEKYVGQEKVNELTDNIRNILRTLLSLVKRNWKNNLKNYKI